MVRNWWLAVAFGAGMALGLFIARGREGEKPVERVATREFQPTPAPVSTPPPGRVGSQGIPSAGSTPVQPMPPPPAPSRSTTAPASVALVIENAPVERHDYGDYNGYSLPVDAGPHFGAQIADSISNGRNDSLAIEHLQLEREVRDDSWSYPLEADLHYMLASDPVMGKFKVEHLECRATLCELRVSGRERLEPPSSAVNQWLRDMTRLTWPGGLTPGTVVFAGTDNGSEGILMLRKPPPRN